MAHSKNNFDLEIVLNGFRQCRANNNGLDMDSYLTAFTELCRFFKMLGTVFGFVSKDIESKLQILRAHRASGVGAQYSTIQGMLGYETQQQLVESRKPQSLPSGARTLLRLHRALEFILQFMERIAATQDDAARTADIASAVYADTLAHHHPWLVRRMAYVAMYTLPTKAHLIEMMCQQPKDKVVELVQETVEQGQPVFLDTQRLYAELKLLHLS